MRATMREALHVLQAQGFAVTDRRTRDGPVSLLRLGRMPLEDLVELRCALEGVAVTQLARMAPDRRALASACAALEEMRDAGEDLAAVERADVAFHLALVQAGGNRALELVMLAVRDSIEARLHITLAALPDPHAKVRRLVREHEALLAAVAAGDSSEAQALAREHLQRFYRTAGVPT